MLADTVGRPARSAASRSMPLARRSARPLPCQDYVSRPRLFETLNRGADGGLTLVVAPAGSGKTTLLSAWAAAATRPVAWLTAADDDADLSPFLQSLILAIQTIEPEFGKTLLSLLTTQDLPPAHVVANELAGELAQLPETIALVLDDFHLIGHETAEMLVDDLMGRLEANIHLILASRELPKLRCGLLRGRGRLVEIGPQDLRFRPDEVKAFLESAVEAEMSPASHAIVGERTEGWAAGLRLVALILRDQWDADTWVERFRHESHPYIEELLLDEVLALQPADVQDFLLRTSIVERLCGGLCDALMPDAASGAGRALLEDLGRIRLLVEPVDASGHWYRYASLFRDALRHRLQTRWTRQEVAALHRRASAWLAAHDLLDEALDHALVGGDLARATALVEQSIGPSLERGDIPSIQRRLGRLGPELVEASPRLLLGRAWLLQFQFRLEAIGPCVRRVEALLARDEHGLEPAVVEMLRAEANVVHAVVFVFSGDGARLMELARQGYQGIPRDAQYPWPLAQMMVGMAHHYRGDTASGLAFLEDAANEESDESAPGRLYALWGQTLIHLMAAQPQGARQAARQLLASCPESRPIIRAWAHYLHGLASYELNALDEAREQFLTVDGLRHAVHRLALQNSLLNLALVDRAAGDADSAWTTVKAVEALPDVMLNERSLAVVRLFAARLSFESGDLESAGYWLHGLEPPPLRITTESLSGSPSLTRARLLIGIGGDSNLSEASQLLDALAVAAETGNEVAQQVGVLAGRALLAQAHSNSSAALQFVRQAVSMAAPGGLVRTFTDLGPSMQGLLIELQRRTVLTDPYLDGLIASFPLAHGVLGLATPSRHVTHVDPALVEQVSYRELEILQLLDARLSNKEIASSLTISSETVKKHTSNIYQKLMVGSRREAVSRAYELGLLPAIPPIDVHLTPAAGVVAS